MEGTSDRSDRAWGFDRRVAVLLASVLAAGAALAVAGSPGTAQADRATVCSFDGPDTGPHGLELTELEVEAPSDPPAEGDTVAVSFGLVNAGDSAFTFDDDHGAYVAIEGPEGTASLGHEARGETLAPDEAVSVAAEFEVGGGAWEVWPAYRGAESGQQNPDRWHACVFDVESADGEAGEEEEEEQAPRVQVDVSPQPPLDPDTGPRVQVDAESEFGIREIRIFVDGGEVASCADTASCSRQLEPLAAGNHSVYATAIDRYGGVGSSFVEHFEILGDEEPPNRTRPSQPLEGELSFRPPVRSSPPRFDQIHPHQPGIQWGGRTVALDVHPDTPSGEKALAASESGGLFRTSDGGDSWTHVDGRYPHRLADVAYAPSDPDTIIATGPDGPPRDLPPVRSHRPLRDRRLLGPRPHEGDPRSRGARGGVGDPARAGVRRGRRHAQPHRRPRPLGLRLASAPDPELPGRIDAQPLRRELPVLPGRHRRPRFRPGRATSCCAAWTSWLGSAT